MVSLLARFFIKQRDNFQNQAVRQAYGILCGALGIFLNLVLFAGKLIAGSLAGSIAITADAFNNLSDAGSSIITLFGFKLAGQKPDPEHPFGHGRMEYIAGLLVSVVILLVGFELGKSSVDKILNPQAVECSWVILGILASSVLVKLYMAFYNARIAKKIHSTAMKATATDSLNDCISTSVVFIVTIVARFVPNIPLDGWCGLVVAVMILIAGIKAVKETISPLLGQPPTPEFVQEISRITEEEPEILGMHDLVVHDYGPGRCMVSFHAEVAADGDMMAAHDTIDNLERKLNQALGCHTVIHMDPIDTKNEQIARLKKQVTTLLQEISPRLTLHDFRMVPGPTHTNLIFDVVLPYDLALSEAELKAQMAAKIAAMPNGTYYAVIDVDRAFVTHA